MFSYNWKWWKQLAITWLLLITFLFLLPGSDIPKQDWLDKIYADKWVHASFFAILLFLWRFFFSLNKKAEVPLLIGALIYAVLIEVMQSLWVANRSADMWDVLADMVGALAGLIVWKRYIKK